MPGEDPLFRQLPAGDTGDGGRHSSRGVVGAEAPKARQVPVTRCQGGGQEAHRSPEKDLAPGALSGGPEKCRLSAASPEPLPPAWEIRVDVLIFLIVVLADKHKC